MTATIHPKSSSIAGPMITVLATRAITCSDHDSGRHFNITPNSKPVQVPEWVELTSAFRLAESSGAVTRIVIHSPAPTVATPKNDPRDLGFGFEPTKVPTLQSLMEAGLTQDAAIIALDSLADKSAGMVAKQTPVKVDAPVVATVDSLIAGGATREEAECIIAMRVDTTAGATKAATKAASKAAKTATAVTPAVPVVKADTADVAGTDTAANLGPDGASAAGAAASEQPK